MMRKHPMDITKEFQEQINTIVKDAYRQEHIYYGIACFIIVLISFFGNLLVCRICLQKCTKTNTLILSLAISDILMTIFNIPFNFFRIANFSWSFGSSMCFIVNFLQYVVVYISSYTMAIIAIQRYQSLSGFRHHFNHNYPSSSSSVVINNNNRHNPTTTTTTTTLIIHKQETITRTKSINSNNNDNDHDIEINNEIMINKDQHNRNIFNQIHQSFIQFKNLLSFYCCHCWKYCSTTTTTKTTTKTSNQSTNIMNNDGFTRRTIYILIIITWLSSALISLLFTYSSEVVAKEDIAYILHLFLLKNPDFSIPTNNNYDNNQTNNSYSNELNGQNPVASVDNHPHFQSSSSSSSSSLSPLNFDHKTMKRCRNPINENVKNFLLENFSIKADLLLTIIVFITQYFIPLAIVGYLYIEIGKIIHRQGKLCDDKGNARARIRQRKKFRRILMLIFMVAAFAICWLPLHIFHILTDAGWLQYNYRIFMVVSFIHPFCVFVHFYFPLHLFIRFFLFVSIFIHQIKIQNS
ncbi:G-protein coupled receptor [Dermatophagoides farinae]|uniref:G-protein coupled receptor n=1 Tax=Dermatophagoides farinae TaxID=6954 RepID=A0A922KRN7_DERFA|nr:G-protein coupled receptor [Dermatophagoides farinae]